ncbi:hypothetical protein [Naasia sp. SYSU D00948]|uniref:hypothetical protein n=1 Tax=Naasia sp. SYSU D00948 TaxID=2817379 RepID=UPI001B3043E9|nr:hypothetical protein [Naasia sp. SYSU D00948]
MTLRPVHRHRGRLDVRFLIGAVLVVGSIAGVWSVVAAAERTEQVYAAATALAVGDRLTEDRLVLAPVQLGGAGRHYLTPADLPEGGLVVMRAVDEGELVPESAVGSEAGLRLASVVVPLGGEPARGVEAGALVDVWAAPEGEDGVYGPPAVLVPGAEVARTLASDGLLTSGSGAVEILVPKDRVARLLQALANGDALSLVPVTSPPGDR